MTGQPAHLPGGPRDEGIRTVLGAGRFPLYTEAWEHVGSLMAPIFLHVNNPHERLFVAALDGTGNDVIHDPEHATNVGLIYDQLTQGLDSRIAAKYVEGPGTQPQWLPRLIDGALGYTADERAEWMYKLFIDQARLWLREDPHAQISIASIGFSRGSEEATLLARIIEERGIQDPAGAHYTYGAHGQIKHVEYTQPALVPPHEVAQAMALFDPVGTGRLMHEDRRPPPSVISGLQLDAMDERRRSFKSDHIIDPGVTPDGRFAGIDLPGAHSDVGGGYRLNGLSNRAGNFVIAYLNTLSDRRYLQPLPEFDDPLRNVIHRSEDGMFLYGADYKVDRATTGGYNEVLVDRRLAAQFQDANNAESRNEALDAKFEHQTVAHAMQNPILQVQAVAGPPAPVAPAPNELDRLIERLYQAAARSDGKAMDAAADDYLRTPAGQSWQQQVLRAVPALEVADLVPGSRQPLPPGHDTRQAHAHPAPVI